MRSVAHWTPYYIFCRIREMIDHRLHPANPWLTSESVKLLDQLLRKTDIAVEFGSGRSTLWFARRVAKLTSVESDAAWRDRGIEALKREKIDNAEILLRPLDAPPEEGNTSAYAGVADLFADASVDFCLVDGFYRNFCALRMISKMKAGGVIAIDNAAWFIPSDSRSPNARTAETGPMDATWGEFLEATRDWRRIWTSSGVTDTFLLFKP